MFCILCIFAMHNIMYVVFHFRRCDVGNLLNTFCLWIFYQISSSHFYHHQQQKRSSVPPSWCSWSVREILCFKLNNVCRRCDDTKYFIYTWKAWSIQRIAAEVVMLCLWSESETQHRVKTHIKQPNNYHQLI
jgi:hypothetical protein